MGDQTQTHDPTTQLVPPPPPSEPTTTDIPQNPPAPPSKIPFRSRKIRKLSTTTATATAAAATVTSDKSSYKSEQTPDEDSTKSLTISKSTIKSRKRNPTQSPWVLPVLVKPLSSEGEVAVALRYLRDSDPLLAPLIDSHQPPTFDSFHPPFLALARSILYQQLAFKAGASIYNRFVSLCGGEATVLPDAVLALSPQQLRQIGISGRKASYLHDLSNKYKNGILSDASILEMDDKSLFTMLTMVKGIGPWSVHMFMIFSLHRPDVLPVGDLGVRKGVQILHNLEELPRPSQMEQLCEKWKPYRSVGAWYMWRFVEAKAAPVAAAAAPLVDGILPEQLPLQPQPLQQQHQLQILDSIDSIANLGACIWGQ
ncbi:hypothetical protein L1049_024080 [Liquidambar formosana]|uniref:HhH-GPD domain-containing protein n=1 Tax=Liquidambar formosana TaxID=63359 RepID=A0AAP0S0T9_LIQFO